jgi:hypothetical protein
MNMKDQQLNYFLLKQRGNNQQLAEEIINKLSVESRDQLLRIFQDIEIDNNRLKNQANKYKNFMPFR